MKKVIYSTLIFFITLLFLLLTSCNDDDGTETTHWILTEIRRMNKSGINDSENPSIGWNLKQDTIFLFDTTILATVENDNVILYCYKDQPNTKVTTLYSGTYFYNSYAEELFDSSYLTSNWDGSLKISRSTALPYTYENSPFELNFSIGGNQKISDTQFKWADGVFTYVFEPYRTDPISTEWEQNLKNESIVYFLEDLANYFRSNN